MPLQSSILVPINCESLPHDKGGKLLAMGLQASDLALKAQQLEPNDPQKKELLQQATEIRVLEKQGWLSIRTPELPLGDVEGAAKASLAIANYFFELQDIAMGKHWLSKALDEAPVDKFFLRAIIAHVFVVVEDWEEHLNETSASPTPVTSGRTTPEPSAQEESVGA